MRVNSVTSVVALVSTVIALAAIALSWCLYMRRAPAMQTLPAAKRPDDPLRGYLGRFSPGLNRKWYIDELYWPVILNPYVGFRISWRR